MLNERLKIVSQDDLDQNAKKVLLLKFQKRLPPYAGGFYRSFQRFEINMYNTESGIKAFCPFKIIRKGSDKIAIHL